MRERKRGKSPGLSMGMGQTIDVGRNANGGRTRLAREIVDEAHRPPLGDGEASDNHKLWEASVEGST